MVHQAGFAHTAVTEDDDLSSRVSWHCACLSGRGGVFYLEQDLLARGHGVGGLCRRHLSLSELDVRSRMRDLVRRAQDLARAVARSLDKQDVGRCVKRE